MEKKYPSYNDVVMLEELQEHLDDMLYHLSLIKDTKTKEECAMKALKLLEKMKKGERIGPEDWL